MSKFRPLAPVQAEALIQAIKRQHLTGTSSRELAHQFGVHYQTVAGYRRKLKLSGVLTDEMKISSVGRPPTRESAVPPTVASIETEDIQRSLEISTPEQILQRLTWLSQAPSVPHTTQVVASKALYEIREAEASREKLSATLPQTRAEALARLTVLRSAVGPDLWSEADALISAEELPWTRARRTSAPAGPPAGTPAAATPSTTAPAATTAAATATTTAAATTEA